MAFWPRDERTKRPTIKRGHEVIKDHILDYPNIKQGLVGAATLIEDKTKRIKWTFLAKPSRTHGESLGDKLKFGKQNNVFPATLSPPNLNASTGIRQRAEQGANFLRTYVPDVEIPEELIRDQLVEDTTRSQELQHFDPYSGNILDTLAFRNRKDSLFLLFPTGETCRDLNFTQVKYSDAFKIVFRPSSTSIYTFNTPIQQILSNDIGDERKGKLLAVRTYSSTQIFDIKYSHASSKLSVTDLAAWSRKDTGGENIVDMKHSLTSPELVVVGDKGTLFNCNIDLGAKTTASFGGDGGIASFSSDADVFWRLSYGPNSDYFLLSSRNVLHLDQRTNAPTNVFSLPPNKHVLTSMEDCQRDNTLHLCSTHDAIWLDARFTSKPLLAYAHGRQYDRYLVTHTIPNVSNTSLTLLSSRNNSMVTVYDVHHSTNGLTQINSAPYLSSSGPSIYQKNLGQALLWHDDCLGHVQMSDTGQIIYNEILLPGAHSEMGSTVKMTQDVQNLDEVTCKTINTGSLGLQEYSEVDFQPAYDALFREYLEETKDFEDETADAVDQMLDFFPSYLQNKELPTETVMTTYDIAFCAGDEPSKPSRADFLADTLLKSRRSFRALEQGRFSPELVKVPWHRSIVTTMQYLDRDFRPDPLIMMKYLENFELSCDAPMADKIQGYEQDTAHELTLDLILSSHVYSESLFLRPDATTQTLETMTEALSLGGEPPQVEFGYLKPVEKISARFYDENREGNRSAEIPLGVRLLLQGWDSADPMDYVYQDPYTSTEARIPIKPKKSVADVRPPVATQSQRPPTVLPSNMIGNSQHEPFRRAGPSTVQSQLVESCPEKTDESYPLMKLQSKSSQDIMVSTQVLPGPHGGRPVAKKKPAKKRLGGF